MIRSITTAVIITLTLMTYSVCPAADDIVIADFNSAPLPAGWKVEGFAFGSRTAGAGRQQAAIATANQRQYQTGKLTSPEFSVERDYIVMRLAGTYHPGKCCVALVVDGRDVRRVSPGEFAKRSLPSMDVREFRGKRAHLEVRDDHFNGWVELGLVSATDKRTPNAQREIPAWEPDAFEAKIDQPYLLLPLDDSASPVQTVTIEIDGQERLSVDMPLAMSDAENYQPVYDLTGCQGRTLRVSYHKTAGSRTAELIHLAPEVPKHETADDKPAFHVHCRFGKLNDPNGLVYHDGKYHLFHQYAYGLRGKHWSHYESTDLMHWQERPIGLFPDETGSMHSGSAAVDWHNSGGFQTGDTPTIVAAFTGSRGLGGPDKIQVQGIAYSTDGARTFTKYQGNPILGEDRLKSHATDHSRDPKIFWYSPTRGMDPRADDGHWVMVLFEDDGHSTFTSNDLKQWHEQGGIEGFHECPELFPLAVDGNTADVRWVMYGANGEYHIGSFDGKTFKADTQQKIRFNHGARHYAAQTFSDTPGRPPRRIQVGWQADQISTPVELSLRTTPLGLRLCSLPVREIENLYTKSTSLDGQELTEGDANPLAQFTGGLYDIDLNAQVGNAKQIDFTICGKSIRYDVGNSKLTCGKHTVTLPATDGRLKLRILIDNCSIDIFAGADGLFYMPIYLGPLESKTIGLSLTGGPIQLNRLSVNQLKSIW